MVTVKYKRKKEALKRNLFKKSANEQYKITIDFRLSSLLKYTKRTFEKLDKLVKPFDTNITNKTRTFITRR